MKNESSYFFNKNIMMLKAILQKQPDLRIGQVIVNCVKKKEDLFFLSDDVIYERLCKLYNDLNKVK